MTTKYEGTKLIEILDPQSGTIKETVNIKPRMDAQDLKEAQESIFELTEQGSMLSKRRMTLKEVAEVSTSQFPALLRSGLTPILFSAYGGIQQTWPLWCDTTASDKPAEDYLEGSHIGLLPKVPEGAPYPSIDLALDRAFQIVNDKRGAILNITREMVLYDRVGIIRQQIEDLGAALAMTKEQDAYIVLTTSGNYTRNSTTGDNDVGANTASTTFGPLGLVAATRTLKTMKDRRSGRYLGIMPDTLVLGPDLEFAAKQLLFADAIQRVGGSTTNDVYGSGTANPLRGLITQIIVSPFMVGGNWVLMQAKRAVVCQEVWGPEVFQMTNDPSNPPFMLQDVYQYRVDENYGFGMKNDRFAYLSTATAAPIVN